MRGWQWPALQHHSPATPSKSRLPSWVQQYTPSALEISRGWRLKYWLAVNGIQNGSRFGSPASAACIGLASVMTRLPFSWPGRSENLPQPVIQHAQRQRRIGEPAPARQAPVTDAGKDVEAFRLAGDGLGQHATREMSGRDAVAGVALGVVDVGPHPVQLGDAVDADADVTAPLVVDGSAGELGEHRQHVRLQAGADALRPAAGVIAHTAEQEPAVRRQAEVVECHPLVADGRVLRQDLAGPFLGQRLGGDDVAAGRYHGARELRDKPVQVGVAGDHHEVGGDAPALRVHDRPVARLDAQDGRALEHARTGLGGGAGLAETEIQWMEVAVALVQYAADVALGADHLREALLRDDLDLVRIARGVFLGGGIAEVAQLAPLHRDVDVAEPQIAVDAVALHALDDDVTALEPHLRGNAGRPVSETLADLGRLGEAVDEVAAVAPARAPADAARLQQHHPVAAFGEFQRGGQAGETAADDGHVGALGALERGIVRASLRRRGVVGGRVFGRPVHADQVTPGTEV